MLAAWLDDQSRYERSLQLLIRRGDPRIPQNLVYLVSAMSLMKHSQNTRSITAAMDRLPNRLKANPLIQRCQVGYALAQDDPVRTGVLLDQVPSRGVPLPIRIYYRIAHECITPRDNRPSKFSYRQLASQIQVLPALTDGNPGPQWPERCILDLLLRTVSSKGDPHR